MFEVMVEHKTKCRFAFYCTLFYGSLYFMAKMTKELEIESLPKLLYNVTENSSENEFLTQSKILSDLKISEPYSTFYPKFNLPFEISEHTSTNR